MYAEHLGKLATEECRQDPEGNKAYTEYFRTGTVPGDYCDIHERVEICSVSGKRAGENCKSKTSGVFITRKGAEENQNWRSSADAKYMAPVEVCEDCKKEPEPTPTPTPDYNGIDNNAVGNNNSYWNNNTNSSNTNTTSNSIYTNTSTGNTNVSN